MNLAPTDPRHGRRAGYLAGCRLDCCRPHHLRYQKFSTLRRHREGSQYVTADRTHARIAEWGRYGVTPNAISDAANLGEGTALAVASRKLERVTKSTERAILAVTWDDLPDTALVNAGLTQHRIYSLMAAGHPLGWICDRVDGLNMGGKWRTQEKVTLGLARGIQAIYDTAPVWGGSKQTAVKARNKGHGTPAAWDDPGLPAMPKGWAPELDRGTHRPKTEVDEAVVLRVTAGDQLPMTTAERLEVVRRLRDDRGWSEERIRDHTGIAKASEVARYPRRDKENAA